MRLDVSGRLRQRCGSPYCYQPGRYARTFLELPPPNHSEGADIPRVIYTIWLGAPMSARRRASLDSLRRANPDLDVRLITEGNLDQYLLPEHPLHPTFPHMSAVHQSDYIRVYLMHFHGGGYSDLKPARRSWQLAFDRMGDPQILVTGYREVSTEYVGAAPRQLGVDLRRHYRQLAGPSAFIMRPHSIFTASFYREFLRRLDYCDLAFRLSPVTDPYDLPASYPLWWGELMGDILHALSLRYHDRVFFDEDIRPILQDYR
ncbi:glycosyltransferase family 32 protein [Tessaracoccus sp. Z1128]